MSFVRGSHNVLVIKSYDLFDPCPSAAEDHKC